MNIFAYQLEKLAVARSSLMLPFADESEAIAGAFNSCDVGLKTLDRSLITDDAILRRLREIDGALDISQVGDLHGYGMWRLKAKKMTEEEKRNFSRNVDECANWFAREHRESPGNG